jgi:hypothetical protein
VVFAATIVASVAMIVWIVSASTARVFEQLDAERTAALVQQFQKEFVLRGEEIAGAARRIAESDATLRVAIDVNRAEPDYSLHVNDAAALATSHGLDFLELVAGDGSIVSSAQWPARFAYKKAWLTDPVDWKSQPAFLKREDLPDDAALALEAVRPLGRRCTALRDCGTAPGCGVSHLPGPAARHARPALPQSRARIFPAGAGGC